MIHDGTTSASYELAILNCIHLESHKEPGSILPLLNARTIINALLLMSSPKTSLPRFRHGRGVRHHLYSAKRLYLLCFLALYDATSAVFLTKVKWCLLPAFWPMAGQLSMKAAQPLAERLLSKWKLPCHWLKGWLLHQFKKTGPWVISL